MRGVKWGGLLQWRYALSARLRDGPVRTMAIRIAREAAGRAGSYNGDTHCPRGRGTGRFVQWPFQISSKERTALRVGMIGTGAISHKHAQAYKNIGYQITVCTDIFEAGGRKFADQYGCEFVPTYEELCRHPNVDYVDVCTFPDFRLQPIEICAQSKKHVQVQKPISTTLETAGRMVEIARKGGILLGVVSQHRFDDSSLFLSRAIPAGRLGKLLQVDCY